MCFYLMFLNIYYWEKLTFSKIVGKVNLSQGKFEEYIQENVYFGINIFSCFSSTKPCLRFILKCFVREIKGFYQSSLGHEVGFRDIINVSPNILTKIWKFKKTETQFCRWKNTDNNDINVVLSLKNTCIFLLAK